MLDRLSNLPDPTITSGMARARFKTLAPWYRKMIHARRAALHREGKYLSYFEFRQLVEYAEFAYRQANPPQGVFDFEEFAEQWSVYDFS